MAQPIVPAVPPTQPDRRPAVRPGAAITAWIAGIASFQGRSTRAEYWWPAGLLFGFYIAAGSIFMSDDTVTTWISPLAFLLLQVSVYVRRAHDAGFSTIVALGVYAGISAVFFLPFGLPELLGPAAYILGLVLLPVTLVITMSPSSDDAHYELKRAGAVEGEVETLQDGYQGDGDSDTDAGWYADPLVPGVQRYFDGQNWTKSTFPDDYEAVRNQWLAEKTFKTRLSRVGMLLAWLGAMAGFAVIPHTCGKNPDGRGTICTPDVGDSLFGILLAVAAVLLISGFTLLVSFRVPKGPQDKRRLGPVIALVVVVLACVLVPASLFLVALTVGLSQF